MGDSRSITSGRSMRQKQCSFRQFDQSHRAHESSTATESFAGEGWFHEPPSDSKPRGSVWYGFSHSIWNRGSFPSVWTCSDGTNDTTLLWQPARKQSSFSTTIYHFNPGRPSSGSSDESSLHTPSSRRLCKFNDTRFTSVQHWSDWLRSHSHH